MVHSLHQYRRALAHQFDSADIFRHLLWIRHFGALDRKGRPRILCSHLLLPSDQLLRLAENIGLIDREVRARDEKQP